MQFAEFLVAVSDAYGSFVQGGVDFQVLQITAAGGEAGTGRILDNDGPDIVSLVHGTEQLPPLTVFERRTDV